MKQRVAVFALFLFLVTHNNLSVAQSQDPPLVESSTIFTSKDDVATTIRNVAVLPILDNVQGIYSRPLENLLIEKVKQTHRFNQIDFNVSGPLVTPEELIESPSKVTEMAKASGADAIIGGRILRGPKGIQLKMFLFLRSTGELFLQEESPSFDKADLASLQSEQTKLFDILIAKIPYSGLVISRKDLRVTINLGSKDGIKLDQVVNVVQILQLSKHPKHKFLISTEKEIIGRIRILKVDDTLSFGQIISERGRGAIQVNSKIDNQAFVNYSERNVLKQDDDINNLKAREDSKVAFGETPGEWVPKKPPTFGIIGGRFGLGSYVGNFSIDPPGEDLQATNGFYPSVFLDAELWLTPTWTMYFGLRSGIITIENPKSGTDATELSHALSSYDLLFSYTFRLGPSVFDSRVDVSAGYSNYRLYVDDTKDSGGNHGLTTLTFSGFKFGVTGKFPITLDEEWSGGAKAYFFFNPNIEESPISSGSGTARINQFGLFVDKRMSSHLLLKGVLDFELYSASFTNGRADSASQRHTVLSAGAYYMF